MLSTEQINALVAAGLSGEQIAAMMNPAPAVTSGANTKNADPVLRSILTAPDPKDRNQTLSHPEKTPLVNGVGMFDGTYAITVRRVCWEPSKKGQILKHVFVIDESNNPLVKPGGLREHPLFQWNEAAITETKGLLQTLFAAKGNSGSWMDDPATPFYFAATGEQNCCEGLRFKLTVYTEPQRKNANAYFSHHKYEQIAVGQRLGLEAGSAPMSLSSLPLTLPPAPAPVTPPTVQAPPVAGLPSTPPANWPKTVKWPGESDAQFAARAAA